MEHVVSTIIEVLVPSFLHVAADALQRRFASSLRLSLSSLCRPLPLSHHQRQLLPLRALRSGHHRLAGGAEGSALRPGLSLGSHRCAMRADAGKALLFSPRAQALGGAAERRPQRLSPAGGPVRGSEQRASAVHGHGDRYVSAFCLASLPGPSGCGRPSRSRPATCSPACLPPS